MSRACRIKRLRAETGSSIVETLVAALLIGMVAAATTPVMIRGLGASDVSQTDLALVGQTMSEVDQLRAASFRGLLEQFWPNTSPITNGMTFVESFSVDGPKTDFTITYTARNNSGNTFPEALEVNIVAQQRRGKFGVKEYRFETVVANLR